MSLRFENLAMLWGLVGVLLVAAVMVRNHLRAPASFTWLRFTLVTLGFTFAVFGLARPQLGHQVTQKRGMKGNLFIAVDVSRSMIAQDVPPSRLGFATAFATRVVNGLAGLGIRASIFPFALDGYVMIPLTSDTTMIGDMLATLGPNMTTAQGTDLSGTLDQLIRAILKMETETRERGEEWAHTQVLLLSDGETHVPFRDSSASQFRSHNIPIFTVAVGTVMGTNITVDVRGNAGDGFLREPSGRSVLTKANPEVMQKIARLSGGDYYPPVLEQTGRVIQRLSQTMQLGKLSSSFKVDQEYYPHLFLIALVLFAAEMLLGRWEFAIRALLVPLLLTAATPLFAQENGETKSPDRRAVEAYNEALQKMQGNTLGKAVELFQESAALAKDKEVKKKALYNLGNALLRSMDPGQAIQAYQQARDVKTGDKKFDKESDQRISENLILAVKLEEEMRRMAKQQQQQQEGQGEGKDKQDSDPKGPQKDYQAQYFDDEQKKKMFDLMASEEQQILQRLMQDKAKINNSRRSDKPW